MEMGRTCDKERQKTGAGISPDGELGKREGVVEDSNKCLNWSA